MKQRNNKSQNGSQSGVPDKKDKNSSVNKKSSKFGPLGLKNEHRVWSRVVLFIGVLVVAYVFHRRKSSEITWVSRKEIAGLKGQQVPCSELYLQEIEEFPGCVPQKCGRFVMDGVILDKEVNTLLDIAKKGFQYGRSSGGASILDLHSGALSHEESFVNIYKLPTFSNVWNEDEFSVYVTIKERIKSAISTNFGIIAENIHLTSPTFFSEMTNKPSRTVHDQYWHPHVDKETYETFHFTSLVYLNDYGKDFQGGRFVFIDKDGRNRTVEPRRGRVSMFTSGSENTHYVEEVQQGTRYALTIAFTCDVRHSIADPVIH